MATEVVRSIRASGGDYTSLSTFEATEQRDLVALNEIAVAECYADWPTGLTDTVAFSGWTTNSTNKIIIRSAAGHEPNGISGGGFWFGTTGWNTPTITYNGTVVDLEDIELSHKSSAGPLTGSETAGYYRRCVFSNIGYNRTTIAGPKLNKYAHARSCISVGLSNPVYPNYAASGTAVAINHVAINCNSGYYGGYPSGTGAYKNCLGYGTVTTDDFQSSCHANTDYCASSDASAPGANSIHSITSAEFVDAANGDYHLAATSQLIGAGANLYTDGSDVDIDGDVRPNGAWDIGFDQYVAGGASSHSIVGSVTVSATPAATLDYQQHPSISGDVTISSTPFATMGFSSGYTIVGDVSVSVTPASVMDHQSHHVIAGGVQTSLTPAAVLDHQSHHAIIGDVALSVTPAATLFFGSGEYIQGDVTISSTPAGVMSFTRHAAIAGNVAVNLTPAAILDHQFHRSLVGDVSISMTPAAVMSYTGYVPLSLSQNDLDAIAESVRLMLVDQGCFTKIDEIWTRLGLNPAAPLTNHTDGSITATGIDIVASSSGENIVQTRQ